MGVFHVFKSYKWYQIAQRITDIKLVDPMTTNVSLIETSQSICSVILLVSKWQEQWTLMN